MNYPAQPSGHRLLFWPVIPCLTRNPVWPSGYRLPPVWRTHGKPRGM